MTSINSGGVFKRGNKWCHRTKILQPDGTVKYSKKGGFATREDAEAALAIHNREFDQARGEQCGHANSHKKDITFSAYLTGWFEEVYAHRIENTTRLVASYVLYDMILPSVEKDIYLKFVNAEYIDELLLRASHLTASAGNKCRELLNQAFKEAVIQGYIKSNPVESATRFPRNAPNVNVLSKVKIKVLLKAAATSNWYLEIMCALFLGLRKGEIAGLKVSDVDIENCYVNVERQVTSNPIISKGTSNIEKYETAEKAPKTANSIRKLKVPDILMREFIKRFEKIQEDKERLGEDYSDNGYISCRADGVPHSVTSFNMALSRICDKNGLPHITVHGLRHMYATILIEQGVPLIKISALLGHKSVATTFEYYCEVIDENSKILSFLNETFNIQSDKESE